jgi:hypothetical protein
MVYLICMGRQQQIILHIKAIFIQVKANQPKIFDIIDAVRESNTSHGSHL